MLRFNIFLCLFIHAHAVAVKNANAFKDQFCTDPRTMRKHAAYTEWADAYSCTRHRCQPGGRNLAIYTVGCKRVEAPESAIECEEVVEDTNMQFPYCCTRLRCLVVVRGEVWTRVLGQPWEVLPAAPWSHMYKMKRPPPGGEPFTPAKNTEQGPVYELSDQPEPTHNKVSMRAGTDDVRRAHPDLVIALTTNNDRKNKPRQKGKPRADADGDDDNVLEKSVDQSQETFITGTNTPKPLQPESVPHMDWQNEDKKKVIEPNVESDRDAKYHTEDEETKKDDHAPQLQTLVDAIGTRMRDIEGVVHRMNQGEDDDPVDSSEKRTRRQLNKEFVREDIEFYTRKKRPSPVAEHYRRFTNRRHGGGGGVGGGGSGGGSGGSSVSKYARNAVEVTSEQPLYVEDNRLPGYYNDPDNPVRRSDPEKDPAHPIYMAPIESQNRRKMPRSNPEQSDEREDKKRKRKLHKRKHVRGKKHRKDEKRRHGKKTKSGESSDDSGIAVY